jgi:hypothetical protein
MNTHTKKQTTFCYSDANSKSIFWRAYAIYFGGEEIQEEGFNINSGYVYIALENGVTIASAFGQPVEFIIYDDETEEERVFDTINEANEFLRNRI